MTAQQRKSFIHGAGILAGAGVIIKIIGACFRIPLGNLIGGEGMGYYNAVYPVYTLLVVIATTGIPIAISRLVAEHIAEDDHGGANRVFKVSMAVMLILGIAFFAVLFFGAEAITGVNESLKGASVAMKAIAPALIFVPVMAAFRGYFQGMQNMKPTALSQVIEQLFRVVCGLALAFFLAKMGLEYAAAGGTFGATAGAAAGVACMAVVYSKFRSSEPFRKRREEARQERDPRHRIATSQILNQLALIALPITLGAIVMPLMWNIDMLVVPRRLADAGFTAIEARSMYGQLTGFAESLMNLPKVLTQAIAISMVPTIVRAWKEKDDAFLHYNVTLGLRFSLIIGLPCAVGFMVLSEPIMLLLYPTKPEDAAGAAPALFIFGIGVIFLSSIDALTSVLQGVGKQGIPLVNIAIGAVCKLGVTWLLTGIPVFNIKGAAIGTVVAYVVATVLNYRAVKTYTGAHFDFSLTFVRPVTAALIMGAVCAGVYYPLTHFTELPRFIVTVCAILAAAVCYVILLFATKTLEARELRQLPKGEQLYALYRKIRPARNVKLQ
ncbi:MAG: polysaccharide biosynthesis protein [Clostridiales Family XIII bacterium]|jgi:stage V sporulation protein B|nr:polysaccharide biosynthesis protein [Clostridiales Family XIII bacterium]